MSETFTYDARNRLKTTKLSAAGSTPIQTSSYTYDNNGNIKSKSTFGATYVYDAIKVHAVRKVKDASGSVTASYDYDAAGRMLNQNGTDIVYTSFGQPQTLTKAGEVTSFKYNADLMRVVQDNADRVLTYLDPSPRDGGHLYEKEYVRATLTTIHRHFIYAPTGRIAEYEVKAKGTTATASINYFLTDHLGSIDAVLPSTGDVAQIQRTSFDAFGARRSAGDWKSAGTAPSATLLGYTGHEQLDQVGLVHMNGRLYDPALGRFTSADPHIDGVGSTQGYNRYSYVQNNPMNATDPSGYFNLRQELRNLGKNSLKATGLYQANQYIKGHEWAQQTLQIGVMFVPGAGVAGQLLVSAYLTAANGGNVADVMSSVISTGWSIGMTVGLGGLKETESVLTSRNAVKILAHGVVGGVSARAGGGNFNDGFKSAAVTQAFSPAINDIGEGASGRTARIVVAAIVGGTAAELGGGKFANGAVTGAFSRAYNHELGGDIRNTDEELEMLEKGNVVGYYESREARGDAYAALALDVVRNGGALGTAANLRLFDSVAGLSIEQQQALLASGSYVEFVKSVNVGLARVHAAQVDLDRFGVKGLLSASQISAYHESYFVSRGLPATTFGGSAFFGYRTSYWCVGCDGAP